MSTEELDPDTLARQCVVALGRVADGIKWAYGAGWYPGRRWIGEPRGAEMRLGRPSDDDTVKAPRHDIGMGDYAARQAVRSAGPRLVEVSRMVAKVVECLAVAHRIRSVPACVGVAQVLSPGTLDRAIRQLDHQLDRLYGFEILNVETRSWCAGQLISARDSLAAMERSLGRWGDNLPEDRGLPVAMCVTCDRRPRPIRRGVLVGRECDTCASYRHRHRGQARPKSLDNDDRHAVVAAQKRRAAAGQGWGWS